MQLAALDQFMTRKHNMMKIKEKMTHEEKVKEKRKMWKLLRIAEAKNRGESVGSEGAVSSWTE